MERQQGLTLIELLVTVTLLSLLLSAAMPALSYWFNKQQADGAAYSALRHVAKARALAVEDNRRISFCGVNNSNECVRNNIREYVVFYDRAYDHAIDSDDKVYSRFKLSYSGRVRLRVGTATFIAFEPSGYARVPGSLYFCPKSGDKKLMRRVTVSSAGRPYYAPKDAGKGYVLTPEGQEVTDCIS